jgi:hypothetical protein
MIASTQAVTNPIRGGMMSKLIQSVAFGLAIALTAPAEAAPCALRDMRGNWSMFLMEHFFDLGEDDATFVARCQVGLDNRGRVLPNSACVNDGGERFALRGEFLARRGCLLSGTLTESFPPPDPLSKTCPIEGTLAQDKLTAGGVCNLPGNIILFQMIKRP